MMSMPCRFAASTIVNANAALVCGVGLSRNSCRSHTGLRKYAVPGNRRFG